MTGFMETAVRENAFVLIVCTPGYRARSDRRQGGVGYEGDIMTAEVFAHANHRKFIPILREGDWRQAAPSWLSGKVHLDFRGDTYLSDSYERLLRTLHGAAESPPPVGARPDFASTTAVYPPVVRDEKSVISTEASDQSPTTSNTSLLGGTFKDIEVCITSPVDGGKGLLIALTNHRPTNLAELRLKATDARSFDQRTSRFRDSFGSASE